MISGTPRSIKGAPGRRKTWKPEPHLKKTELESATIVPRRSIFPVTVLPGGRRNPREVTKKGV